MCLIFKKNTRETLKTFLFWTLVINIINTHFAKDNGIREENCR